MVELDQPREWEVSCVHSRRAVNFRAPTGHPDLNALRSGGLTRYIIARQSAPTISGESTMLELSQIELVLRAADDRSLQFGLLNTIRIPD